MTSGSCSCRLALAVSLALTKSLGLVKNEELSKHLFWRESELCVSWYIRNQLRFSVLRRRRSEMESIDLSVSSLGAVGLELSVLKKRVELMSAEMLVLEG